MPVSAKEFSCSQFLSLVYEGQDPPKESPLQNHHFVHAQECTARTSIRAASRDPGNVQTWLSRSERV